MVGCKLEIHEIDGKQYVSARDMYLALGYDVSNYSRWCNKSIDKSMFFIEFKDWFKAGVKENCLSNHINPNPSYDYMITTFMAKSILLKIRHNKNSGLILKHLDEDIIIHHTQSRFEHSFGDLLAKQLNVLGVHVECQKRVFEYRVDFYIKEYNLAIEYDETQHFTATNIKADAKREKNIKSALGCDFIRLNWKVDDAENVAIVIKEIINRIKTKTT